MKFINKIAISLILLFLAGCGSGGSSGDAGLPPAPDLFVFFVSGHDAPGQGFLDGEPSKSYLQNSSGPEIIADLRSAGYNVNFEYFVDDANRVGNYGGYQDLVKDMKYVRDELQSRGTKSIVIAHSHGGVWAHAAINKIDDLTVTALVDLDTSSFGWFDIGHTAQNNFIGGDPTDFFVINNTRTCPEYPNLSSEQNFTYDMEDVIFPNIRYSLEVRGSDRPFVIGELYDEKWNIRVDGNTDGLDCYSSGLSHTEAHQASGKTITYVKWWLRDTLAR